MCSGGHLHGLKSGQHHLCGCVYHYLILKQSSAWFFLAKNTLVAPCAPRVYAKFKQNLTPSKLPSLARMQFSHIRRYAYVYRREDDDLSYDQYTQGSSQTLRFTFLQDVVPDVKHLPCAKVIKPGEMAHLGSHIHSIDDNPFHYCDSR